MEFEVKPYDPEFHSLLRDLEIGSHEQSRDRQNPDAALSYMISVATGARREHLEGNMSAESLRNFELGIRDALKKEGY